MANQDVNYDSVLLGEVVANKLGRVEGVSLIAHPNELSTSMITSFLIPILATSMWNLLTISLIADNVFRPLG